MPAARALAVLLGLSLLSMLVVMSGTWVWLKSAFPTSQGPRVRGPHDIVGVWTDPSYAWVIPTRHGVVLIDTGIDPTGQALLEVIGDKQVQAVLLTHAHPDHTGGLAALPQDVPLYAAQEEISVLQGHTTSPSSLVQWLESFRAPMAHHGPANVVRDGEVLQIDGLRILAKHVPGHTGGSLAYLWEEVLFTGDAVLGGPGLTKPPAPMTADPKQAVASLSRLAALDFDAIADGHVGLTKTARPALLRMAGVDRTPPTLSMRTQGATATVPVEREGTYVQWPVPDVRGHAPALVVFEDGTVWRLADVPVPDHAELVGKRVIVNAKVISPTSGPGIRVDAESVRLAPTQPPDERPLPQRLGEIVPVDGAVGSLTPLTEGAAWGEGEITLANGIRAELSAPLAAWTDGHIRGFAHVTASTGDRIRLVLLPPAPEPVPERQSAPPPLLP